MKSDSTLIKGGLTLILVVVCAATLFVPLADGANSVRDMFVMLTMLAVKSFFDGVQEDKRVESIKQAYDPTPPESFIQGEERG